MLASFATKTKSWHEKAWSSHTSGVLVLQSGFLYDLSALSRNFLATWFLAADTAIQSMSLNILFSVNESLESLLIMNYSAIPNAYLTNIHSTNIRKFILDRKHNVFARFQKSHSKQSPTSTGCTGDWTVRGKLRNRNCLFLRSACQKRLNLCICSIVVGLRSMVQARAN